MRFETLRIILKQIGNLLILLGVIMCVPALVSFIYKELYSTIGFALSGLVISTVGLLLKKWFIRSGDPQYNHALITAASGWLVVTIMGSIPFLMIAWFTPESVLNGFIPSGSTYNESSLIYFKNPLHYCCMDQKQQAKN